MELPNLKNEPKKREVTGEIVYLDQMRYNGTGYPGKFSELTDTSAELYNVRAGAYRTVGAAAVNARPAIMDLYDEYDSRMTNTEASCIALADELLKLKDEKSPLTFVDFHVDTPATDVLDKMKLIIAGELLTADDEQLAIVSDGEHYPILDMRKEQADLVGVGLRVWGWNHEKYMYTDSTEEDRDYKRDLLVYPADEKLAQRQLEITFAYRHRQPAKDGSNHFSESISLTVNERGYSSLSRSVHAMVYAETGYEGHMHKSLNDISETDIAAFGSLVAEIVGDEPESVGMRQDRELAEVVAGVASDEARHVVQELIDATWPAQANFILSLRQKESEKTLAKMLQSADDAERAVELIQQYLEKWRKP
jgi:hypothetical protein